MLQKASQASALPAQMEVAVRPKGSRQKRTPYEKRYEESRARLLETFVPDADLDDIEVIYGPEDPRDFYGNRFENAPKSNQVLHAETMNLIEMIDQNDGVIPGDPEERELYETQIGHLDWWALNDVDGKLSPKSWHFMGPPGSGKTLLPCSAAMIIFSRLQMRGEISGNIAYCTAKSHHLPSKVRNTDGRRNHILRASHRALTQKDLKRWRRLLMKADKDFMKTFFPPRIWNSLEETPVSTVPEAIELLDRLAADRGLTYEEEHQPLKRQIAMMLVGQAAIVPDTHKESSIIEMAALPKTDDDQTRALTGDAVMGLPDEASIYAPTAVGVSTASLEDANIILTPATLFTSSRQVERHSDAVHQNVAAVICDEAQRRHAVAFQEPVHTASGNVPFVVAAGSVRYNKQWDRESPAMSVLELIRRGILPHLGVQMFPSAEEEHYPAESTKAVLQLLEEFFKKLELYKKLGIAQPEERNTVLVVHSKLIDVVIDDVRAMFPKRLNAQVRPYYGNDEDREILEDWFDTERGGTNVLVLPPSIKESMHLASLRRLVIGCRVSADALFHLTGRLYHGQGMDDPNDRMLLSMQQFADSNLKVTPFTVLSHGQDFDTAGFMWANGQALMSDAAFMADKKRVGNKHKKYDGVRIPTTRTAKVGDDNPIVIGDGGKMLVQRTVTIRNGAPGHNFAKSTAALPLEPYNPLGSTPPSSTQVQFWASEVDGSAVYDACTQKVNEAAINAHEDRCDPRVAVHRRIAMLRERPMQRVRPA